MKQGLGKIDRRAPAYGMPTVRKHAQTITELSGVTLAEMLSPGKVREVVSARWDLWAMLFLHEGWTICTIARRFRMDHTTVLYALRTWSARHQGTDPKASLAEIRDCWQASQMGRAA